MTRFLVWAALGLTALGMVLIWATSRIQNDAARLQGEFDLNAPNVNLHEVMASLQKASLSFQTMVQVRNRLVSAYQEIMNMQV